MSITGGPTHLCGILDDGSVACWGTDKYGQTQVPEGGFSAVSNGYHHSCGIRVDGTVACWGRNDDKQSDPPEGLFVAVAAGPGYSCGLRTDGTIECWGEVLWLPWTPEATYPPHGDFVDVDTGGRRYTCGLGTDGAVRCWGAIHGEGLVPPSGRFTAIATGQAPTGWPSSSADYPTSCGIRAEDRTLDCWGSCFAGSPPGQFTSVSAGLDVFCGIRVDGHG